MKGLLIICVMLAGSAVLWAQTPNLPEKTDDVLLNRYQLHQMLRENIETQLQEEPIPEGNPKSVSKAVLFSAAVPGMGQMYAKSYIKGALFFVTEVAAWTVNIIYNNKGDDKTAVHRSFVDEHWSEQRYWSYVYYRLNGNEAAPDFPHGIFDQYIQYDDAGRPLLSNWQEAEDLLDQYDDTQYLRGFTHQLPGTKTQQYYEMVGKYPTQFGNAWDDASFNVQYDGYTGKLTPNNARAEDLRAELNNLYNIAGYGSMVALVNHLVSAIDAGFTTRNYNRRQMRLTYERRRINGERVNMYGIRMDW